MQTINRNNYEEFFLLYIDGELPPAEKQAVEQFVLEHPDLGIELEMFRQTLLLPDEQMVFADKETLFRGPSVINNGNYETYLLSYIDDELNTTERTAVESFMQQNPVAQETLALLKQAKLEAEPVICPDKQALYRTTVKERPVVYLRWQRIAAAAVIAGLCFTLWTVFSPGNPIRPKEPVSAKNDPLPVITGKDPAADHIALADKYQSSPPVLPAGAAPQTTTNTLIHKTAGTEEQTGIQTPVVYTTLAKAEPVASVEKNEGINTTSQPLIHMIPAGTGAPIQNNTAGLSDQALAADQSKQIVYKELETNEDNKGLLLGSIEINKDKLRGFFRKASSIFKSKAAKEEDDGRGLK